MSMFFIELMLKAVLSRLTRLLFVAIAGISLLLGSVACSDTTPEDLPQLDSVSDRLRQPSTESQSLDLENSASQETATDRRESLGNDVVKSAADVTEVLETTTVDVAETVQSVTADVDEIVDATTDEVTQGASATPEDLAATSPKPASEMRQTTAATAPEMGESLEQQLEAEQASIQETLKAANEAAAAALEAEVERAAAAFDEEVAQAKSRLQPALEEVNAAANLTETAFEE